MANKKISELTATTTPANADVLPIVQGGVTKKITYANLLASAASGTIGNYSKFTAANTLGDALLSDDGTNVILPSGKYISTQDTTKVRIDLGATGLEKFEITNDGGASLREYLILSNDAGAGMSSTSLDGTKTALINLYEGVAQLNSTDGVKLSGNIVGSKFYGGINNILRVTIDGNGAIFPESGTGAPGSQTPDLGKSDRPFRHLYLNDNIYLTNSALTISQEELSYVYGVSSNIQTQLDSTTTALDNYQLLSGKGAANGYASLDATSKIPLSEIPASLIGAANYQGAWNASTNTPALASGVGTKGYYYVVSVAGATNIDGITDWKLGDWIIFNGTIYEKVDNTDAVISVNGLIGAVSLTGTSNRLTISGANIFDISSSYVGQSSITTLGTIGTGVWNGTAIAGANGGTGVANTGKTITLAGNLVTTGAFNTTFAQSFSGVTTLPPSATVLAGSTAALTTGRVPYVTTGGLLLDSANLTYDGANLIVASAGNGYIYKQTNDNSALAGLIAQHTGTGNYITLVSYGSAYTGTSSTIARGGLCETGYQNNTAVLFRNTSNTNIHFSTNDIVRMTLGNTGILTLTADLKLSTAGQGIYLKEGTNATMGLSALSAGTVTVSTTKVTANSRIQVTPQDGTTNTGAIWISARTAGTSFTISSTNILDARNIAWIIIEPS